MKLPDNKIIIPQKSFSHFVWFETASLPEQRIGRSHVDRSVRYRTLYSHAMGRNLVREKCVKCSF